MVTALGIVKSFCEDKAFEKKLTSEVCENNSLDEIKWSGRLQFLSTLIV